MTDEDRKAFDEFAGSRGYRFGTGYDATREALMDAWRNALAHARRAIPVAEALPPEFQTVVAYEANYRIHIAMYVDGEFHTSEGDYLLDLVTHWGPLHEGGPG